MTEKNHALVIFAITILGSLFGVLYSINGAVDPFILYSVRAAEEIVLDGKIVWDKEIYLWAVTQNHAGLELLLSNLLIILQINPLEFIYLPIGSFLYSLVIAILIINFIAHKTNFLSPFLLFLFSIITVLVVALLFLLVVILLYCDVCSAGFSSLLFIYFCFF
ncbi:MAG: hypothetical protein QW076_04815, partial [Candidatus Anstonellales archaeon]